MYAIYKNMKIENIYYTSIWLNEANPEVISIIDQRYLPHRLVIEDLHSVNEMVTAIL